GLLANISESGGTRGGTTMRIRFLAVFAAFFLPLLPVAAFAQSDDQPLVIPPHPAPGQAPRVESEPPPPQAEDNGGPGQPYAPAPQGQVGDRYVPPEAQGQGSFS